MTRSKAHLSLGAGLDEESLYAGELDALDPRALRRRAPRPRRRPWRYLLLPAHPWQWEHKLAITFAPDVARRDIVCLGVERPTATAHSSRSVRSSTPTVRSGTTSRPRSSIQNMGFMRGLSPRYMRATPAINDWVAGIVEADEELRECGFGVLRERAAIGYTGDAYHRLSGSLGVPQDARRALAREPAAAACRRRTSSRRWRRCCTATATAGTLVTELIAASRIPPREWVATYLRAYLRPIVHCLLRYDLAFMPHGENLILVLQDHVPTRVLMKDIGEEVAVLGDLPLPDGRRAGTHVGARPSQGAGRAHRCLRRLPAFPRRHPRRGRGARAGRVLVARRRHDRRARSGTPRAGRGLAGSTCSRPSSATRCLNRLQLRNTLRWST